MWIASADIIEVPLSGPSPRASDRSSTRPLIVLIRRGGARTPDPRQGDLTIGSNIFACILIGSHSRPLADQILALSRRLLAHEESSLVLFVHDLPAPLDTWRSDPPIDAVLAPAAVIRKTIATTRDPIHAVYAATSAVLSIRASVQQLLVRTPGAVDPVRPRCVPPITLAMPHRGAFEMFLTCMHYIARQWTPCDKVQVYFDEDISNHHHAWLAAHREVEGFRSQRPGTGPYPGRHYLASNATTPWVMFQDSDDAPCSDRVTRLSAALSTGDMIGSHEVRIDEFRELVHPIRFPLDVTAALSARPSHALLHPTSVVKTSAYVRSGGFSTNRIMGSDSQFLLRAHFSMQIRNVDAFLYVKRDRAGSLTRTPGMAVGCPERRRLNQLWEDAFCSVRDGRACIEHTALAAERGDPSPVHRIK